MSFKAVLGSTAGLAALVAGGLAIRDARDDSDKAPTAVPKDRTDPKALDTFFDRYVANDDDAESLSQFAHGHPAVPLKQAVETYRKTGENAGIPDGNVASTTMRELKNRYVTSVETTVIRREGKPAIPVTTTRGPEKSAPLQP